MSKKIFVDTNVLFHDFMVRVGNSLSGNRPLPESQMANKSLALLSKAKFELYIASISFPQLVSLMQSKKHQQTPKRYSYSVKVVEKELKYLLAKYYVVPFGEENINETIQSIHGIDQIDIEDNLMYKLALKAGCTHIMTYNLRDYATYMNLFSFAPNKMSSLREFKFLK